MTIAAPCGLDNMRVLKVAEMDRYLDFWNLMVSPHTLHIFKLICQAYDVRPLLSSLREVFL
jgi:hypothetical protein